MTLQIVLTVIEVVVFVAVLAYFLRRLTMLLGGVGGNLEKIADGVRAVEGHCALIGPGTDEINDRLAAAAGNLERAAAATDRLRGAAGVRA